MAQKKQSKLKQKSRIIKKPKISLKGLKSARIRESARFKGLVQRHSDVLKLKNGQLKKGAKKQIESKEQIHILTKAMQSTADGIFIIDVKKSNFPVIYFNQSFQQMTGYTKKQIMGKNYFCLYRDIVNSRILQELKQAICAGKSFHGEMLNLKHNGQKSWNSLRIAPVRDAGGAVTHYVGIKTDITVMRQKEQEIIEQREELLHVTRVGKLAEFVSSLAHEISQPLTAILAYAQAAQRMLISREKYPDLQKIISYIINDNQRAAAVIHRLRSLLKKSISEMKLLNINTLLNDTVLLISTDAAVRNDVIKIELENNLPFIRGDQIQLQQVVLNLISNSFDALDGQKKIREIMIRTKRKDIDTIMVEVQDSGCGIPAQNISKLFTRFFTSKPDGLGMGLSISRSIIEAHGGHLDVKNNFDGGATFYFTLPVDKKDSA